MSEDADDKKRRPLPRWRYAAQATMSREHGGERDPGTPLEVSREELDLAGAAFGQRANYASAIDLLNVATHYGSAEEMARAASFLRTAEGRQSRAVQEQIGIAPTDGSVDLVENEASLGAPAAANSAQMIRYCRQRLVDEPRNVVLLLDMARAYTVEGISKAAERMVRRALAVAPDHRLVLRRAARWMVHADRTEEALDLIRRHPRTVKDPWLMATEISLAEVMGVVPTTARRARIMLAEAGLSPGETTELSSAVGTMDLAAGDMRRGRKLLRASLLQPTDNSIAQAQWLSRFDKAISVNPSLLTVPSAKEARFLYAHQRGKWSEALRAAIEWQQDEPFSSRPAISGSFLATNFSSDPLESVRIAQIGLRADPDDQLLRNNLVVGLVMAGPLHFAEAQREFTKIRFVPGALPDHVFHATSGLIRFTLGELEAGRRLYQKAHAEAPAADRSRVLLYWFNAESLISPSTGEELRSRLAQGWLKDTSPLVAALRESFEVKHQLRLAAEKQRPVASSKALVDPRTGAVLLKF